MSLCLESINYSIVHSKVLAEASSVSIRSAIDHQQNRVCFSTVVLELGKRGK
jgi:hypothetical protein